MSTLNASELSITQIAKQTGLSAHTLRYYERIGLISAPLRSPAGRRLYRAREFEWISFLCRLRKMGMPIKDMKTYAALRAEGDQTIIARRALLEQHRTTVFQHIESLTINLKELDKKIRFYDGIAAEK